MLNELFYEEMQGPRGDFPFADAFGYDVTVYVNRGVSAARDAILSINPYAAYDVTQDEWALLPQRVSANVNPAWEMSAERDRQYAEDLIHEYGEALQAIQMAQNPAHRTNAENRLQQVMDAGAALFEELHSARRAAFGPAGAGYADFNNYRWQAGKRNGVVQASKKIREYLKAARDRTDSSVGIDPKQALRERQLEVVMSRGPVSLYIDSDPERATMGLKRGVSTLLFAESEYAHFRFRPDVPKSVRPWDELVAERTRQQALIATDRRAKPAEMGSWE